MRRLLLPLLFLLPLVAGPRAAHGSPSFPEHIANKLATDCPPGCRLCHGDDTGLASGPNGKFGKAIRDAGAGAIDLAKLDAALQTVETNLTDSDADGQPDIAELRANDDPNVAGASLCGGPQYGCGASIAQRSPAQRLDSTAGGAAALTLLFGLFALRRHRR